MQEIYPQLRELGVEVLAVSFTPPEKIRFFMGKYPLPFPVVSDPQRKGYEAFELGRTSLAGVLRPGVLWRFLKKMFRGWMPAKPAKGDDVWQLGGDFLLDRHGVLRFAYASSEPTDRPSQDALLQAARSLSA